MKGGTIRAFIAIELPREIRDQLYEIQTKIRKTLSSSRISWVKSDNIHLTLKFLGDITQDQVSLIDESCDFIRRAPVFDIRLSQFGFFPNAGKPRVIWCGYDADRRLSEIQKQLDEKLSSIGFSSEEKQFTPHLTLARVKEIPKEQVKALSTAAKEIQIAASHPVHEITLFQSTLSPSGSIYTPLRKFSLTHR